MFFSFASLFLCRRSSVREKTCLNVVRLFEATVGRWWINAAALLSIFILISQQ